MNISLLISGNLTGFGRFYTSPAANELLGSEKISLDNHDYLVFLNDNEKAYSITFAKRYVALSQYTQILDSFRRPGKLVITLLLPRDYTIVPNSGSTKGAAYSLLTKVSDKFFEKNFQDGMINQNPAVLGQDYYSEILEGYSLKPQESRKINLDPSPIKKVGYVRAVEMDIPSYLDSPYRKSYGEGAYNLVFFAPSAPTGTPNSIDEEPEEVVLYKVKILNTGALLSNQVKLSAPIHKLQARPGEKQFPIEGTYNDVVEHQLEPRITGRIVSGEIIEIQYNFEKEEKTIKFTFVDMATSTPVGIDMVLPSIVFADGSRQPMSSDLFTFRGTEIYDDKKIIADNPAISISPRSERLDLSRLSDNQELKVYVQQGFNLPVDSTYMNLPISFVNKNNGQNQTFINQRMIHLSGSVSDWNMYVDSDIYYAPPQPLNVQDGRWSIKNLQQKKKSKTPKTDFSSRPTSTDIAIQTKFPKLPQVNFSDDTDDKTKSNNNKPHNVKLHKYLVVLPILLLVLGGVLYAFDQCEDGGKKIVENDNRAYDGNDNYKCYIKYHFSDGKLVQLEQDNTYTSFDYSIFDGSENKGMEGLSSSDYSRGDGETTIRHLFQPSGLANEEYYIQVSFIPENANREESLVLTKQKITQNNLTKCDTIEVDLGIITEHLKWYKQLSNPDKKYSNLKEKENFVNAIEKNMPESEFRNRLLELAEKRQIQSDAKVDNSKLDIASDKSITKPDLNKKLGSIKIKQGELAQYKQYGSEILNDGVTVSERLEALKTVFTYINKRTGAERPDDSKLSDAQREAIRQAFNNREPKTIQDVTEGHNFNTISGFLNFINEKLD